MEYLCLDVITCFTAFLFYYGKCIGTPLTYFLMYTGLSFGSGSSSLSVYSSYSDTISSSDFHSSSTSNTSISSFFLSSAFSRIIQRRRSISCKKYKPIDDPKSQINTYRSIYQYCLFIWCQVILQHCTENAIILIDP